MQYKFIDITQIKEPINWPAPRDLTPEEEAELIAQYKAQIDPVQMEKDYKQLMEQFNRGELVDAEELLKTLDASTPPRKPA